MCCLDEKEGALAEHVEKQTYQFVNKTKLSV